MDNHINQNCKILNKPTRIYHLSETFIIFAKNTITRLIYILMETNNEQEKKRQNYQKEIERLVEAGKKLMAEANEIIGALPETQKGSIAMNNKKNQPKIPKNHPAESPACHAQQDSPTSQGKGTHLGFWGNLCALFVGYKTGEMLWNGDEPTTDVANDFNSNTFDDYERDIINDFEQGSIDDYIEEEEEY